VFFVNILCLQRCKPDVNKSVVTAMWFAIDDKHLIKWMWEKNYTEKNACLRCLFDRRWSLDWVKTLINILVDFCSGVGIVWSTVTRTGVSDANAVTFSVKCFNSLKLYFLSGNIFRKWFASYFLFVHEHLINIDLQR